MKLTDNDKRLGPIVYGKASWNPTRLVFSTGCDEHPNTKVTVYTFGWVFRMELPTKFHPYKRWVDTSHYSWSEPGGGYFDVHPKEYGFSYHEGFLQLFLGAQTHDSLTTKSWSCHLPWTQWRFIRRSLYNPCGSHFWTEPTGKQVPSNKALEVREKMRQEVPKRVFEFEDFDGEVITATTHIEEREWRFGEGWFKWLSLFKKPMIRRNLAIYFSKEVGPEKGSWKGGTIGHSIAMLPNESCESAFSRYCEQKHTSKNGKFKINFMGELK